MNMKERVFSKNQFLHVIKDIRKSILLCILSVLCSSDHYESGKFYISENSIKSFRICGNECETHVNNERFVELFLTIEHLFRKRFGIDK